MQSILSRFRTRAVSQTTTDSSQSSPGPITPTNLTNPPHEFPINDPTNQVRASPIQRKIYPGVNSLLEEYASQSSPVDERQARRHSVDSYVATPLRPRRTSVPPAPAASAHLEEAPRSMTPSSGQSSTGRFLSRISSIATSGEWSTFGRAKNPVSPGLTEFGEQPSAWHNRARGKDKASSARSSTTHNRSSQPSSGATPSKTPSRKSSDRHIDITNKENTDIPIKSDTQSPASTIPHSNNTPSSQSQSLSSRFARLSTPVARQLGFDSPHTFGNPSPHVRGRPDTSPPPPLPPLDHPELAASLAPRAHSLGGAPVILDCDAEGRLDPALFPPNKTYPPRTGPESRIRTRSNVESTGAETFGHAVRPSRSMPRAQSIFRSSRQKRLSRSSPSGSRSSRAGSKASPSGSKASRAPTAQSRRASADLFSRQAAAGVAPAGHESDWAARVSEEMIRLSLEGSIAGEFGVIARSGSSGAGSRPGSGENKGARGPGPTVPKSAGAASSSPSFPSTIPTIPPLSPSLFASFGLSDSPRNLSLEDPGASAEHSRSDGLPNTSGVAGDYSFIARGTEDRERRRSMQDQGRSAGKASNSVVEKKALRSSLKTRPANGGSSPGQGQRPIEPIASSSRHADASSPFSRPSVSVTAPTPTEMTTTRLSRSLSDPSALQTPIRSNSSKGKRKAEEVDVTPPELKSIQKATSFALPSDSRASQRTSASAHAPSSYHRKRARLSSPLPTPTHSRPGSAQPSNAHNTGTASSRTSSRAPPQAAQSNISRAQSMRSARASASAEHAADPDRRRSLSQVSMPISAFVTPHAPSVGRSSQFHMRDPRRPPRKLETPWSLRLRSAEEDGSPVQAWLFFIGFVLFPLWWLASVLPTPQTRELGADTEKAVTLDDPQIEFDAKSWRFRCRVMSAVSLVTYIPFIVLIAIFAPR